MADDGFKYQLSSKIGDHMLNVRADSADEFRANIDSLFGEGASVNVLTPFFVSGTLNAPAVASAPTLAPAPSATPTATGGESCPACGEGQLVVKQRKDGKGSFKGCNRFPKCNFISREKVA